MAFDIDQLVVFCTAEIRRFAADHQDEIFYAFAIDASLLCLSSEEAFAKSLKRYEEQWEQRVRPIESLEGLSGADLRDVDFVFRLREAIHNEFPERVALDRNACLASVNASRAKERNEGNPYHKVEVIKDLRDNTGDWACQGFADMASSSGFDEDAYDEHYNLGLDGRGDELKFTEYGMAMDEIVRRLVQAEAFNCLKTTPDFKATRVEHDY